MYQITITNLIIVYVCAYHTVYNDNIGERTSWLQTGAEAHREGG